MTKGTWGRFGLMLVAIVVAVALARIAELSPVVVILFLALGATLYVMWGADD